MASKKKNAAGPSGPVRDKAKRNVRSNKATLDEDGLTPQQARLKRHLLDGMELKEACAKVGINRTTGWRYAQLPQFQAALRKGQVALEEAGVCTRIDLMRQLWAIGSSDIRQLIGDGNNALDAKDWPEKIAPAVASVKIRELYGEKGVPIGFTTEFKLHPKTTAIDLLGKMIGAYAAPKEPVGPDGKPVLRKMKVFLIPSMRTEADMADHGVRRDQRALPPPEPEEAPVPAQRSLKDGLRKIKASPT